MYITKDLLLTAYCKKNACCCQLKLSPSHTCQILDKEKNIHQLLENDL